MTKVFLLAILTLASFSFCAQTRQYIKDAYAFTRVIHRGMVRVDNNGNPQSNGVDTSYNVYVETAASVSPTFDAIWVHNKPYVITSSEVIEKKVQVGYSKISDEPVELAAKTGNKLWRLDIGEPASIKKASSFITATSIVIEGKSNNRSFYFKVAKERELKDINGQ